MYKKLPMVFWFVSSIAHVTSVTPCVESQLDDAVVAQFGCDVGQVNVGSWAAGSGSAERLNDTVEELVTAPEVQKLRTSEYGDDAPTSAYVTIMGCALNVHRRPNTWVPAVPQPVDMSPFVVIEDAL